MPTYITPDARLLSAVPYLSRGARIADIGTDHAYLPIYLVGEGIAAEALAADINQGPIDSAERNIRAAGLSQKIRTFRTDGLHGVEPFHPDHVLIFGMGGELIAKILDEAPWVKDPAVTLVLQPMSRASVLRAYLTEAGFAVIGETLTRDEKKIYQTVAVRYCGKRDDYTEEELLLGRWNIEHPTPLFAEFVRHEIAVWEKILAGKSRSEEADTSAEERVLAFLKKRSESLL